MDPYNVSEDTIVIPDELQVPGVGVLPVNAMVIRGEQPLLADTLAIVHRESYLERAFGLVDPEDVRWLFISHEDRDHTGSIMQVLDQCRNARLITTFLGFGKLGEEFSIPPERVYFLNHGESLDIGDRTVTAVRPPLFDSSATRGLFDPSSGVYFGADCFGMVMDGNAEWSDELEGGAYEEGYLWLNRANHIWCHQVPRAVVERNLDEVRALEAQIIVSGHGPSIRGDFEKIFEWTARAVEMEPVPMPTQAEFEEMLAAG